jgi:ribonucleoside-diphosphate reductase alpha chain
MKGKKKAYSQKLPDKVTKRDGRVVTFDQKKVVGAIVKAVAETQEFDKAEAERMAEIVVNIMTRMNGTHTPTVEEVQDVVEQVLMAGGHYETAKAYILYRAQRTEEREAKGVIGVEDDLGLSLNQLRVIEKRYLMHDGDGAAIETPRQWLTRVARTLAGVEKRGKKGWEKAFFEVMASFKFLPAGRTLNNAGTKQNQLANCFVLPVDDSMEGIFDAVKWTAMVHQTGGGTGFNFSKLRPSGDVVSKSAGGYATGPVSFMKVFDVATRQVMQGGKKRGANMGILNVDHPDIMEFITCKTEEGEIANFNISVGITDEFMKAVKKDKEFLLKNPRTGEKVHTIKARTLMDQIVTLAWRTGDPGMINLSAINRTNPLLEAYGPIDATNPCGEQPLHPFDACNLGSINLAAFVKAKNGFREKQVEKRIDWQELSRVTRIAVRMLDNVIDACSYPIPQIAHTVKANRRIGLGVMGWADMLFQLRVAYDSKEAVALAERVMSFVQKESWEASRELGNDKGVFPRWKESAFAAGWDPTKQDQNTKAKDADLWRVRNMAITTIAPTGTISMAADTSSGIEPVFALSFVKNVVNEEGLTYVNRYFEEALNEEVGTGSIDKQKVISKVAHGGALAGMGEVPDTVARVFVTAHDISWEWHVRMQAAFQKYTDNAVSKTINFPASATIEEIKGAYMLAWELGCKGITVYRDSSKSYQVLSHKSSDQKRDGKGQEAKEKAAYLIQSKLKVKTLKERKVEGLKKLGHVTYTDCPECGGKVSVQEGCSLCMECGWSVCG